MPQVSITALTRFVSRGLSGATDLFLCLESAGVAGIESYLQRLALLTAGRHLETRDLWLGVAGTGRAEGDFAAGDPVCSVEVHGETAAEVLTRLHDRHESVLNLLEDPS